MTNEELNESNSTDESLKTVEEDTQNTQTEQEKVPYTRFKEVNDAKKQAETELNQLRAQIDEAKRKEDEEAGRYKDLYEEALKQKEQALHEKQQLSLTQFKTSKLAEAGFTGERLEKAKAFVKGDTEEELSEQIALFTELIPPEKSVDPSVNAPGAKTETKTTKDKAEEKGREAARKLFKRK
ncbi:hypothetical protein [Listeria seeligeri]|uniref:hypothetical protein n=1 Tax=Listeria seeligeri TaxID=1640 RepID=UPI00164CF4BC|nr:hypothetical protein [Listeria seeligeri]MBC6130579.1 hypothetical protein [Listeria seeligeri]MBF2370321.1 hypothetical protein [Listeria seeligeri]MBF2390519.1 hypothetical protein [Listeria seeligeri]